MIHYILAGAGRVRSAADFAHSLVPCTLAVIPTGMDHWLEPTGEIVDECDIETHEGAPAGTTPEMVVACGLVRVRYGAALGLFDNLSDILVENLSDISAVRTAFDELLAEQTSEAPGSDAMKSALMSQCIVHLFRRLCGDNNCTLPWLAALQDEGLARALDRILQTPGDMHTVESLAGTAAMSRSTFAELFTRSFGVPPMSMVRRIRMERAWKLLEQGQGLPIETVARRVGFSSRSHFSRAFKRHFGVSPLSLRDLPS